MPITKKTKSDSSIPKSVKKEKKDTTTKEVKTTVAVKEKKHTAVKTSKIKETKSSSTVKKISKKSAISTKESSSTNSKKPSAIKTKSSTGKKSVITSKPATARKQSSTSKNTTKKQIEKNETIKKTQALKPVSNLNTDIISFSDNIKRNVDSTSVVNHALDHSITLTSTSLNSTPLNKSSLTSKKLTITKKPVIRKKTNPPKKRFVIKPDAEDILKTEFPTILDALKEAKRICTHTKKQVYVYKKLRGKLTEMGVVSFFYNDFFASIDNNKKKPSVLKNEEDESVNEKKRLRKVKEEGELPILSKDWDKL